MEVKAFLCRRSDGSLVLVEATNRKAAQRKTKAKKCLELQEAERDARETNKPSILGPPRVRENG